MKPSSSKNCKLVKQFPFLADIISVRMEPFDGTPDFRIGIQDLTIKVEKADRDLMFRQADNVGLGDPSFIVQAERDRNGQVMQRGEYIFAVGINNRVINRVDWPRNDAERRQIREEIYAHTVLWGKKKDPERYSGMIYDKVKFLVWVTVEVWHTYESITRFGEFRDRAVNIHVTIYGEPECGFENLYRASNVYENLVLDSNVMMLGIIDRNYDIIMINGMLNEMCTLFKDRVYFNGMRAILDANQSRGVSSGQFGTVKVLAGEVWIHDRVMLKDTVSWISFQLRSDSRQMYVIGQLGTLPQIRRLVMTVVRMWNQNPELREAFKPDQNVSVVI